MGHRSGPACGRRRQRRRQPGARQSSPLRDAGASPLGAGLLTYGAYDPEIVGASQTAFGDGSYILSSADMVWFWKHYLRAEVDRRNPLAAPLLADLAHLPPLLVTAAEIDPLLDDSTRLVARLEAAAVPHRYVLWPGVTHACLHMTQMLDVAQDHIEDMAAWARAQLSARAAAAGCRLERT